MAIAVSVSDEQTDRPIDADHWQALAAAVIGELAFGPDVELSIRFVDAATITDLNERYLHHEGPTDVLSFPIEDDLRCGTTS